MGEGVLWHLLAMFLHGNVWHLMGNMLVFWLLRRPLYLGAGLVIGFLCSWLPTVGFEGVTVGFSGVLFGIVGVKWGVWSHRCRCGTATYWTMMKRVGPFLAVGVLLPGVDWCLHVYCFVVGVIFGAASLMRHRRTG